MAPEREGLDITIHYVPQMTDEWTVTRRVAEVLHSPDFAPIVDNRLINFRIKLNPSNAGGVRNDGTGSLVVPKESIGLKFLKYVKTDPIRINGRKLKFFISGKPSVRLATTLAKTPYVNPDLEEERAQKVRDLEGSTRVNVVQFGVFYREKYPSPARSFSIEWERKYITESYAALAFNYDHKQIHLTLGSELHDSHGFLVVINISSIQKIAVGMDAGPYICFETLTPPILEQIEFHRLLTGDDEIDNKWYKKRVGYLDERHREVSPYAPQLRLCLYNETDIIERFIAQCEIAGIAKSRITLFPHQFPLEASGKQFFSRKVLFRMSRQLQEFSWPVAFQLESLFANGALNTRELDDILPEIKALCRTYKANESYVEGLLKHYAWKLSLRNADVTPQACLKLSKETFQHSKPESNNTFLCCHVTFTPTRMILEGPYPTQTNRIVRQFAGYEGHFIRVDFRDEDRLQYRWDRAVDGATFVRERVGGILKHGFALAGRRFEFLAYSNSALREHAVWFIHPFSHPTKGLVTAASIRSSIGNFEGTDLMKQPSKFAARLAQAFTATDRSVSVRRDEWEMMPDMHPPTPPGEKIKHFFTDGVGTISRDLARRIWKVLCQKRSDPPPEPSAYQIRFLGFKGVVVIDDELDNLQSGIHMRLRDSMQKFEVSDDGVADLEIALAFEKPNTAYLNRPLVMVLEDIGVRKDNFLALQNSAVAKALTIDESLSDFNGLVTEHHMGAAFGLRETLRRLEKDFNMDLTPEKRKGATAMDDPFFRKLRRVARHDILRDIKHHARVAIDDSYLLVGVADEGPAYEARGYKDVFCLEVGEIFACIQKGDEQPIWLEGNVSISRSPVAHQGDIQRVRAIGKPPETQFCCFRNLRNVVVMPSRGPRPLASMLGGGDLDGDLFSVICHPPLLPATRDQPMDYESCGTLTLERDSTVDDICDFIVEYINSDLLGLLSDRLLTIADQSSDGIYDPDCQRLAKLCAQAVDYPKQGIAVSLKDEQLPKPLMRQKPDWHAAEVVAPRRTDYYESDQALGYMFRAISLDDPTDVEQESQQPIKNPAQDPITNALLPKIQEIVGDMAYIEQPPTAIHRIYKKYVNELRYICITHTLTNDPGTTLIEEEAVVGTILAKCSQKRWRSDRVYRMNLHTKTLANDIRKEFLNDYEEGSYTVLTPALEMAWMAWNYSVFKRDERVDVGFGAHSFGLIALSSIFEILDLMEKLKHA